MDEEVMEARGDLKRKLVGLSREPVETFVGRERLGEEFNFAEAEQEFKLLVHLYGDMAQVDLQAIPRKVVRNLSELTDEAYDVLRKIANFSLKEGNATERRASLIDAVREHYGRAFQMITPIVAYRGGTDTERNLSDIRNRALQFVNEFEEQNSAAKSQLSERQKELEQLLSNAKDTTQELVVGEHATIFKDEADHHRRASQWWLATTVVLAFVAFGLAVASLLYYLRAAPVWTREQTIQITVSKLLVFSILFSALLWSGKVYRSHRHNFIVNQHRHNALATFKTFALSAPDEQTKSAVLLQASQCIFSPQNSGYQSEERDVTGFPTMLEIVRSTSSSK